MSRGFICNVIGHADDGSGFAARCRRYGHGLPDERTVGSSVCVKHYVDDEVIVLPEKWRRLVLPSKVSGDEFVFDICDIHDRVMVALGEDGPPRVYDYEEHVKACLAEHIASHLAVESE
jgi:hypothetical protein